MRTLLIDDLRNITADRTARTFKDGVQALKNEGPWDVLYLDHDLGEVDKFGSEVPVEVDGNTYLPTGYGIMCFLEANPEYLPGKIELVTSNPVGRQKMKAVIDKLYGDNKNV